MRRILFSKSRASPYPKDKRGRGKYRTLIKEQSLMGLLASVLAQAAVMGLLASVLAQAAVVVALET